MEQTDQEIIDELTKQHGDIAFEAMVEEAGSPLNEPVIEKDIAGAAPAPEIHQEHSQIESPTPEQAFQEELEQDAPEQIIEELGDDDLGDPEETKFELPTAEAKLAADTILGVADNVIEIGGGFFVKIKKHKEFYEFEEIIELIDEQNEKNIKRLKLDKADKALLRPLIMAMLKEKSTKLTPQQQLITAVISIVMKKAQLVMQGKAENELLVERILDIIREEKQEQSLPESTDESAFDHEPDEAEESESVPEYTPEEVSGEFDEDLTSLLEVAEEPENESKDGE